MDRITWIAMAGYRSARLRHGKLSVAVLPWKNLVVKTCQGNIPVNTDRSFEGTLALLPADRCVVRVLEELKSNGAVFDRYGPRVVVTAQMVASGQMLDVEGAADDVPWVSLSERASPMLRAAEDLVACGIDLACIEAVTIRNFCRWTRTAKRVWHRVRDCCGRVCRGRVCRGT